MTSDYAAGWSLDNKVQGELHTLRNGAGALAQLLTETRRKVERERADTRLKPEAIAQEVKRVRLEQGLKLVELGQRFEAAHERAVRSLVTVERELKASEPPDAAMARELEHARLWARFKSLLEAPERARVNPLDLVERERENLPALRVLSEELPDWGRVTGNDPMTEGAAERVDAYILPLLPEPERRIRKIRAELAIGWPQLKAAKEWAAMEIAENDHITVLPGWGRGESVNV